MTLSLPPVNLKPEMRYGFVLVPEQFPFIPSTVSLTLTAQAPTLSQISVAPLVFEKLAQLVHEYEPAANVSVAPSEALVNVEEIWAMVVPAVQFQVWPLPVQAASAPGVHKTRINTANPRMRISGLLVVPTRSVPD